MQAIKRTIALVLTLVMAFSVLPEGAFAAEIQSAPELDTGNVTIEGTNGFGHLLGAEISKEQSAAAEAVSEFGMGYTVTDLEITGNTATVTYDAMEEAVLIVALYSEDGMQMLASGKTTVTPDATEATVTIEGTMPQYFLASAYLVDSYDFTPLCEAYESPMYTQDMQELLNSTIYDYSTDRILNLDEDETTNFAVFSDETKIIEYFEGFNTVISADQENGIYVFGNVDHEIASLVEGDIFAYIYGDNQMIIAKVASTHYEDGTITITAADMEMQEAFRAIKIESGGDTADMVVDESSLGEGVTYLGIVSDTDPQQVMPQDQGYDEVGDSARFGLSEDVVNHENFKVNVSGFVEYGITLKLDYYVTLVRQHMELKLDYSLKFAVTFSGTLEWDFKLCDASFQPIPALGIGIEPTLHVEIGGKVTVSTSAGGTVGMVYDDQTGLEFVRTTPTVESKTEFEGTIFVGMDFKPQIEVVAGAVADVALKMPYGFEATFKPKGNNGVAATGSESTYHKCKDCLDIELFLKLELGIECKFVGIIKVERTITAMKFRIGYFYYSLDLNKFETGRCNNIVYRLTVAVEDLEGNPVADMPVVVKNLQKNTNAHGNVIFYLPDGAYKASCDFGGSTAEQIFILDQAKKVTLKENAPEEPENIFEEKKENPDAEDPFFGTVDESDVIAFGTCGNNQNWVLDRNGTLTISGTGEMEQYVTEDAPWRPYADKIMEVVIGDGITSVCESAFYGCNSILEMTIGASVADFDMFQTTCPELYAFRVSADNPYFSSDSRGVLFDKEKQVLIRAPRGMTGAYEIPGSVSTISEAAFWNCMKLNSVTIPSSVETIAYHAFAWCAQLTEVLFYGDAPAMDEIFFDVTATAYYPANNMTWTSDVMQNYGGTITWEAHSRIDGEAVESGICGPNSTYPTWTLYSNGLLIITGSGEIEDASGWKDLKDQITDVQIGEGITEICDSAFMQCRNMVSLSLPNTLKEFGINAFNYCTSLRHVTIPDKVGKINARAFENCHSLESVIIGSRVHTIQLSAFGWCYDLETIIFRGGTVGTLYSTSFSHVTATAYYPEGKWAEDKLKDYGGNITWVPYTLDENGDMILPTANDSKAEEVLNPNAIYGGEYSSEVVDQYLRKTASFSGLVPGADYLLLAMKRIEAEDPLGGENLLYVDQGTALADGTLVFTYVQRENAPASYVVACGPTGKNLQDAVITFPEMTADGEVQVVAPSVVYDGKTLTEGKDYTITGDVSFIEGGTYTCIIEGIRNYTGLVECTYTVNPGTPEEPDTPEVPEVTAKIISYSTSLGGNIAMNFYVELSEDLVADPDAYIQFTFAGQTKKVPLCDGVPSGTSYRFACPITSKNMTDEITAQVYNANGPVGDPKTMAVDTYCNWIIANTSDQKTINLMKAMLNYGASAQMLFNYRTDDLANAALSTADKTFGKVDASAFAHSRTGEEDGIKPVSYTLLLDSETTVRCYFQLTGTKTIDEFTFMVDGVEVTPTYKDGYYYIEKANIAAHRLDDMHTFTCGNITITYGGLSYVNQVMTYYTSGTTFDMASALYAYSKAAESYIG